MKMIHRFACLAAACACFGQLATAQETLVEAATEQAVDVAKGVESATVRFQEWAEENGEEIERWSERYSADWEKWAERFETKIERWAAQQESEWEKWADEYSRKWESWGNRLDAGEFNSEDLDELIKRNLEALSEIPLGQMVDGFLREGVAELKDAPWESLHDLKKVFKESFEKSMNNLDRDKLEDQGFDLRLGANRAVSNFDRALAKIRDNLAADQEKQTQRSREKIEAIKLLLEGDDLTDKQRKDFESMLKTVRDTNARRIIEAREKATKAKADLEEAFAQQAQKNAAQQAKAAEKRAMKQAAAAKNRVMKQANSKAELRKTKAKKNVNPLEDSESKRKTAKSVKIELQALREEIRQLRREVNELQKLR